MGNYFFTAAVRRINSTNNNSIHCKKLIFFQTWSTPWSWLIHGFPPPDIKIRIIVFWLREMCSCTYCANASIVPSIFSPLPGSRQSCWLERQNGEQEHALLCLRMQHGRLQQVEEVMLKWGAVLLRQEKRSPSAFSSLQGYLQPQIYPERSTSVPLTSPVRDVCAEKAQSLLLVKNEGVPQQVLWDKSVSPQRGEDEEQTAAHFSCIWTSASLPRFCLLNRFPRNNLVLMRTDKQTGLTGRDLGMP